MRDRNHKKTPYSVFVEAVSDALVGADVKIGHVFLSWRRSIRRESQETLWDRAHGSLNNTLWLGWGIRARTVKDEMGWIDVWQLTEKNKHGVKGK